MFKQFSLKNLVHSLVLNVFYDNSYIHFDYHFLNEKQVCFMKGKLLEMCNFFKVMKSKAFTFYKSLVPTTNIVGFKIFI